MKHVVRLDAEKRLGPDPWQMALVALCALILCSCRSPVMNRMPPHESLPPGAYADASDQTPAACPDGPPGMEQGVPLPYVAQGPWSPPGLRQPWPEDEYLRDGGDELDPAGMNRQGELSGVDMEDAVAKYDTLDGRTLVEPSNKVYLYSPRFGAVRQVVGLIANEERQRADGVSMPEKLAAPTVVQPVADAKQQIQPKGEIAALPAAALRTKQLRDVLSTAIGPEAFQSSFQAYENLAIIRQGVLEAAEMPLLARGSTAAIAWTHNQAVEIILDHRGAMAEVKYDSALSVYTAESPPGCPRLRLFKLASTPLAKPGDEVDFTLRFDNVGNQPLQNVAILDSLSTRLEYIAGSAQCSVEANFAAQPNEGGSEVVRCELCRPLEPGQGGILRFRCRVR